MSEQIDNMEHQFDEAAAVADASDNVHEDAAPADETSQHAEDVEAAEGEAPHSPHLTLGENTTAAAAPPSPRHHEASLGSNTDDKPAQEDSNPHHLMPPAAPAEVVQQPPTAALDDPMGEQLDSSADGLAAARQRDSTGHDTAAGELAGHDTAALVLAGHGTAAAAPAEQATLAVFTDVRTGDETGQADTMSCTEPPHCKQQICAKGNISSTGHTPTHASAEKKVKGMRCRATATKAASLKSLTFSSPPYVPTAKPYRRVDYSHSTVELLKIAHDNQLLVHQLTTISKAVPSWTKDANAPPAPGNTASSAVNRRRQAAVIAQENHALYQRLVAIRPSKDIRRDTLELEHRQSETQQTQRTAQQPTRIKGVSLSDAVRWSPEQCRENSGV